MTLKTCLLGILCLGTFTASAQLITEENMPESPLFLAENEAYLRISGTPKTLNLSVNFPFKDDFSQATQVIDTNLWYVGGGKSPSISLKGADNPPTIGTAEFDGISPLNDTYSQAAVSGAADVLESHYLDLSALQPADSLLLTFWLQPQGKGDAPEAADGFEVHFRKSDGTWILMYSKSGSALTAFQYISIPVTGATFFHNQFQIRFRSVGGLYGKMDTWHLDYVYLGVNRQTGQSAFNDVAVVGINSSAMEPYTAVPYQQFYHSAGNPEPLLKSFSVTTRNLSANAQNIQLKGEVSDNVGGNIFTGVTQTTVSQSISAQNLYYQTLPAFSDQNLIPYSANYRVEISMPSQNDDYNRNNTYVENYRVDSLMAYDDGSADGSVGINNASGSLRQKFTLTDEDSLTAIWVCFVPTVNYLTSGATKYMDDYPFRLGVWSVNPDERIFSQTINCRIKYGDSVNYFHRYEFLNPKRVTSDIWVGLEQIDYWPLRVGIDKNYDNSANIQWENNGVWETLPFTGTLMIRPEFRNVKYHPFPATANEIPATFNLPIFPNPSEENCFVNLPENVHHYRYELLDVQGKVLASEDINSPSSGNFEIPLPASAGIYLLKQNLNGNEITTQKVVKH